MGSGLGLTEVEGRWRVAIGGGWRSRGTRERARVYDNCFYHASAGEFGLFFSSFFRGQIAE